MTAEFHRARSLEEACILRESLSGAMVYAGGTAIQILIKQGLLFADDLIDIAGVPGLDTIEEGTDGFRIGPMTSIRRVETDPGIRARAPLAAAAYHQVANPRIRNTATVGGNISHGDYRLDPPTALMVLDGRVEVSSVRGTQMLPVREFFVDFQETALAADELVSAIEIPNLPAEAGWGYSKMSSLAMNDWPVASVAALLETSGGRKVLRLGLGALAPTPRYVETEVSGSDLQEAVDAGLAAAEPAIDPLPDVRGSTSYKRRLGLVAVEEAVRGAWKDKNDG